MGVIGLSGPLLSHKFQDFRAIAVVINDVMKCSVRWEAGLAEGLYQTGHCFFAQSTIHPGTLPLSHKDASSEAMPVNTLLVA